MSSPTPIPRIYIYIYIYITEQQRTAMTDLAVAALRKLEGRFPVWQLMAALG